MHLRPVVSPGRAACVIMKRRWCVLCYQEMLEQRRDVYDKLIWQLPVVTSCELHGLELQETCPSCRRSQPMCSLHTKKWRCAHCNGNLMDHDVDDIWISPQKAALKAWVNRAVTDLLMLTGNTEAIRAGAFGIFVRDLASEYGLHSLFDSLPSYSHETILQWRSGRHVPALPTLLDVSMKRNVPPVLVVTAPELAAKVSNTLPFNFAEIDIWPTRYRRHRRSTPKHDGARIRRRAEALLKRLPAGKRISQQEFARRLGVPYSVLVHWAREVVRLVHERNIRIGRATRLRNTKIAIAAILEAEARLRSADKIISRSSVVEEAVKSRKSSVGLLKIGYSLVHQGGGTIT
jgi:transcriptional regulator with XRE-family HTH domain